MKAYILLLLSFGTVVKADQAWKYPGVPYTDWAYDPFTYPSPTAPAEWPSSDKVGFFFIGKDDPNASDTVDDQDHTDSRGMRYGYPDRPRKTFPVKSHTGDIYPAGTVMWLSGGTWADIFGTQSSWFPVLSGTAENPVWIHGDRDNKPVFTDMRINPQNSKYFFIENLVWEDTTYANSCVKFNGKSLNGQTHHGVVRNCTIQNKRYLTNGAIFEIVAPETGVDSDVHDIVVYNNIIKNCGGGVNWNTRDADFHGFKIDGAWGINRTYRVWVINNVVLPGDRADPVDGFIKGLSGSFVQIGDELPIWGNVDHIFVAGNSVEHVRQACVGCKRCGHVIVCSNTFTKPVICDTSFEGQAFNIKYDRQENLWFIANRVYTANAGIVRGDTYNSHGGTHNPDDARVYIVENVFSDLDRTPIATGWRYHGIVLHDQMGKVYIVNNTVDHSIYGVYSAPTDARQSAASELHIYNNIFTNINNGGGVDPSGGHGIYVAKRGGGLRLYIENNLFDDFKIYDAGVTYTNIDTWNTRPTDPDGAGLASAPGTAGNLKGSPSYLNAARSDYRLRLKSPGIDMGTQAYKTNTATDVYQQFIDIFSNDPDFPGNPADVWPRDFRDHPRVKGSSVDIGAYEDDPSAHPSSPENPTAKPVE